MACKRSAVRPRYSPQKIKSLPDYQEGFFIFLLTDWTRVRRLHAPNAFGEEISGSPTAMDRLLMNHPHKKLKAFPTTRKVFFMSFIVYIIYSAKLNRYYTGYTTDIGKRIIEHNSGKSVFTSKATDWVLKWKKHFASRESAMQEERRIKAKKSRKYIEYLIGQA